MCPAPQRLASVICYFLEFHSEVSFPKFKSLRPSKNEETPGKGLIMKHVGHVSGSEIQFMRLISED